MGSAARTFALPELLEVILISLPTKDLLLLQRVAKLWKATVAKSSALRQALFLEPIAAHTAWVLCNETRLEGAGSVQYFRLGQQVIQQLPVESLDEEQLQNRRAWRTQARLNELLAGRGHWRPLSLADRTQQGEGVRLSRPKCPVLGSGLRMFLTQPPCCHLSLWLNWGRPLYVYNESGIRLEDVLREIQNAPILPYLPQIFMQLQDVICLTDAEEKHIADSLADRKSLDGKVNDDTIEVIEITEPVSQRTEGRVYMWRND